MGGMSRLESIRHALRHKVAIGQEFTVNDLVHILATRHTAPTRGELANLLRCCPEVAPVGRAGDSDVVLWRRVE